MMPEGWRLRNAGCVTAGVRRGQVLTRMTCCPMPPEYAQGVRKDHDASLASFWACGAVSRGKGTRTCCGYCPRRGSARHNHHATQPGTSARRRGDRTSLPNFSPSLPDFSPRMRPSDDFDPCSPGPVAVTRPDPTLAHLPTRPDQRCSGSYKVPFASAVERVELAQAPSVYIPSTYTNALEGFRPFRPVRAGGTDKRDDVPFSLGGKNSGASVARTLSSFRAGSKVARKSRAASISRKDSSASSATSTSSCGSSSTSS